MSLTPTTTAPKKVKAKGSTRPPTVKSKPTQKSSTVVLKTVARLSVAVILFLGALAYVAYYFIVWRGSPPTAISLEAKSIFWLSAFVLAAATIWAYGRENVMTAIAAYKAWKA